MHAKRWTRLACAVLLCGLLAGCAGSAPQAADDPVMVAAVPARAGEAAQSAAEAFRAAGGGDVRIEVIPEAQYERRAAEVLLAGLKDYDLLYLSAESLPKWAGYHALLPWPGDIEDNAGEQNAVDHGAVAAWLPLLRVEGVLYGLPAQADPLQLWYREDLRAANGLSNPAASPEDFRAYALAVNAPPGRYAYQPAYSESSAGVDVVSFLHVFDAEAVDAPGSQAYSVAIGSPEARHALDFFAALRHKDGVTPPPGPVPLSDPGREGTAGRLAVIAALREGRAAMGFAPRSAGATLLDCPGARAVCDEEQPLLAAADFNNPANGGQCRLLAELRVWAIPLRSARAEEAARFAGWLASAEGARAWSQGGGLPAVEEPGNCFQFGLPPLEEPEPAWKTLRKLAVEVIENPQRPAGLAVDQAVESLRAELRRQGRLKE